MCVLFAAVFLGGWHLASAQSIDLSYLQSLLNNLASQVAQVGSVTRVSTTDNSRSGSTVSVQGGSCSGGAPMPSGTLGQMIYCNGSRWVAGSGVWTNGQTVRLANLGGSGGAYVCADAQGILFRSNNNCAVVPPTTTTTSRSEISLALGEGNGFRSVVYTSSSVPTTDVTLGTFRLQARNQDATINSLTMVFNRTSGLSLDAMLRNLRLVTPNGIYTPSSIGAADGRISFTNLSIHLPQDQWKDIVLKTDVLAGVSGSTFTKLVASSIAGVSANYDVIGLASGVGDITAGNVNFAVSQVVTRRAEISTALGYDNAFTQTVSTSPSAATPNVSLGGFRLKAQNQDATVNSLSFNVSRNNSTALTSIISNVRLSDGVTTYNATSVSADGSITFNNLNTHLSQDQWKDLFLRADILPGVNYTQVIAKLLASSITGVSADYSTTALAADATDISANNVIFRLYQ